MYELILEETLKCYAELPVIIPKKGRIAGFAKEYVPASAAPFKLDNYHYPMGTTFLRLGVSGIASLARENASKMNDEKGRELLLGIAEVYDAVANYFKQYVAEAERQLSLAKTDGERARLTAIRDNMKTLSASPPQSFAQGLQLYYLIWKLRAMRSIGADLGRLDMHLFPLFDSDLKNGRLK